MKSTGIVRRIDELGRVVLPVEMRRAMRIGVGDTLEINCTDEGILLTKYSTLDSVQDLCATAAQQLHTAFGYPVVIFDSTGILTSAGSHTLIFDDTLHRLLSATRAQIVTDDGGNESVFCPLRYRGTESAA